MSSETKFINGVALALALIFQGFMWAAQAFFPGLLISAGVYLLVRLGSLWLSSPLEAVEHEDEAGC